jgi:hypothetical protein
VAGLPFAVGYCGDACRELDATAHADSCTQRRRLARACALFSPVWRAYLAETYDINGATLVACFYERTLELSLDDSEPDDRGWCGNHYALDFPDAVGNLEHKSELIQAAVLYDHKSTDV